MPDELTVSAKRLGWLHQPSFCPRCFHIQKGLNWKRPYAIPMPIYTKLDRAQKQYISTYIDVHGHAPDWMSAVGSVVGHIHPPSYTKFFHISAAHNVKVRGNADLILELANGHLAIVDLKTANPNCENDHLAPTYLVQQNAYALAAEFQDMGTVDSVSLLYMTAMTDDVDAMAPVEGQQAGMVVPFEATHYQLDLNPDLVENLCGRYRELCEAVKMPEPLEGCKECALTEGIADIYQRTQVPMGVAAMDDSQRAALREKYCQLGLRR